MNAGRRTSAFAPLAASTGSGPGVNDVRAQVLLCLAWAVVVVPQVIESLTTPQFEQSIEVAATPLTPVASLARLALTLALVGTAAWTTITAVRLERRRLELLPLVVFLAPWVVMVTRDWYVTGRPGVVAFLTPVLVLALWALQPRMSCLSALGYLTAVGAAVSIGMAVLDPSSAIFRSSQGDIVATEKEILPFGMLKGFLTQPNSLGKFLILGLPATLLIPRRGHRAAAVSLCVFAVVWSASRTSLEAAGAMTLTALVLGAVRSRRSKRSLGALAVLGAMTVVCVLPFLPTSPTAFTNRSFIWQASLPYWRADPWFGQGSDWYERIAQTSSAIAGAAFYAHNQLVQLLVTGGLTLTVAVGLLLWLTTARACREISSSGSIFGILFLVTLAGTFTLEVSFPSVNSTASLPIVLVPLAVIAFSRDDRDRLDPGARKADEPRRRPTAVPPAPMSRAGAAALRRQPSPEAVPERPCRTVTR